MLSAVSTTSAQAAAADTSSYGNCGVCNALPPVFPGMANFFRQTIDAIKTSKENAYLFPDLLSAVDNGTILSGNSTWDSFSGVKCIAPVGKPIYITMKLI